MKILAASLLSPYTANYMKLHDFHYDLPPHLIAQTPLSERSSSRLLVLDRESGEIAHQQFSDLLALLQPGDLLVFNDTKVIQARLYGQKSSGGKLEVLIERVTGEFQAIAHMRSSHAPKPGSTVYLTDEKIPVLIHGREGEFFILEFPETHPIEHCLEKHGHIPLPPYITRADEVSDFQRYQTVYAREKGAVAAPTAGLHFDENFLAALKKIPVEFAFLTLHVGAGTFQSVRVENIHEHKMHFERYFIPLTTQEQVQKAKQESRRVIAVGTTSARALESAYARGSWQGETDLYITPGFQFQCVDGLITNFHLPESTLLMLVSALAGIDNIRSAYQAAVQAEYRFFSYGDAMLIL